MPIVHTVWKSFGHGTVIRLIVASVKFFFLRTDNSVCSFWFKMFGTFGLPIAVVSPERTVSVVQILNLLSNVVLTVILEFLCSEKRSIATSSLLVFDSDKPKLQVEVSICGNIAAAEIQFLGTQCYAPFRTSSYCSQSHIWNRMIYTFFW